VFGPGLRVAYCDLNPPLPSEGPQVALILLSVDCFLKPSSPEGPGVGIGNKIRLLKPSPSCPGIMVPKSLHRV
jgi:hypothetical protein